MKRAWKHPTHLDTFMTLSDARESYPHIRRFKRVWASTQLVITQRGQERIITRDVAYPRRTK